MGSLKSLFWKQSLYQIITTALLVCFQTIDANCIITYEMEVLIPEFETITQDKEVITSQPNAFSITVLSDVPVLHRGMPEITPETPYFRLYAHNLEKIEVGTFDYNIFQRKVSEFQKLYKAPLVRHIFSTSFRSAVPLLSAPVHASGASITGAGPVAATWRQR